MVSSVYRQPPKSSFIFFFLIFVKNAFLSMCSDSLFYFVLQLNFVLSELYIFYFNYYQCREILHHLE